MATVKLIDDQTLKMAEEVLKLLCSNAKLDRDKGVTHLESLIESGINEAQLRELEGALLQLLGATDSPWETLHGSLMGSQTLVSKTSSSDEFNASAKDEAIRLLEHCESRVRLAAGELLGSLCKKFGPVVYISVKNRVLEGVKSNLERQPLSEADHEEQKKTEQLVQKLAASNTDRRSSDAEQIFHDTAGWKSLETWMKCLQCMIEGCASSFNDQIDQDLLDLIFQSLSHTNRFVRETGFYVCAALVGCNYSPSGEMLVPAEENAIYRHGHAFAKCVATGLADNWSQVRLASSVAARQFLVGLPSEEARQQFYPTLLPPLCLNRYYVAEGVRIYNQQTWKEVTHTAGKQLVERHIQPVVEFYITQSEADNHAVREAACACIAELGAKIPADTVRPHVHALLEALIVCFKDDSWPVRDASCVACGNFIKCFPEESKSRMDTMYPLFFDNLQDNIPSVRQGAAVALANVVKAYGAEAMAVLESRLEAGLKGVENQAATVDKYGGLDKGPATYGVVKRMRDNDMELHTDQQMYSCGSLAPKMGRGGKRGAGCMDHQFRRPAEPWEFADGCVWLMGELSAVATETVVKDIPLLVQACSHQHYTQHVQLCESFCKMLPTLAKGVGKRHFKAQLENFFEIIFYSLSCDNALTSAAASQCLTEISNFIGPNILKGRVENYNPRYAERLSSDPPLSMAGPAAGGFVFMEADDFRPHSHFAPLGASPPPTSFMKPSFFPPHQN